MFFFMPLQGILVFVILGTIAASTFTLWPIVQKRRGAKNG
jgi:hypothetical protein